MERWLFRFGPKFIPDDGRRDMAAKRGDKSETAFLDMMWGERYPNKPPKSHKRGYPVRTRARGTRVVADPTNVRRLRAATGKGQ